MKQHTSLTIGAYHIVTHKAGSAGFYEGRPRGTISVREDSSLYLYKQSPWFTDAEWRAGIEEVFCADGQRLRGTFPNYEVI